ncbi:hypothetical protein [Christiangramia fulva]|uniref:hypothetical protein n=1 Tax=Christiangramia fulva TaxID=2126553 RepID=UPI0018768061|nr:hypothetical protein [Christiangramia fulva]
MKINKIISLLIVSFVLLFSACEPQVDEQELHNTTNVEGVELVATQSTTGGNEITLEMVTPGITGYWDYNLGKALTNRTTFVYPIPGTASFTYVGTLGSEFFTKTIEVEVDQLDHDLDQDWYDLVGDDTAAGKTWVFDGGPQPDGRLWWFMSPPNGKDGAWTVWWNAAGECCPPSDASGKMKFDLDGAANYTYYADPNAEGQPGSFVLDVENQKLIINNGNILGSGNEYGAVVGNPAGVYEIVSLTEDQLVLYVPHNGFDTGWTWVFKPEGSGDTGDGGSAGISSLPISFDDSEDYVSSASGVGFNVVTNPQQSGINPTETMVGEVVNAGSQYEALTISLANAIDFSGSNKTITMKVYSETAFPVLFKLETGVNGERANEVQVNHGGTGWEELTFDFNNAVKSYIDGNQGAGEAFVPTGQYDKFSIFLDFAGTTAGTFYIDDIEQN